MWGCPGCIRVPVFKAGESQVSRRSDLPKEEISFLFDSLKLANEVIVYEAGAAELHHALPVDVHPHRTANIEQVLDELFEGHTLSSEQTRPRRIGTILGYDGLPKHWVIVWVRALKLVPKSWDKPLEGLPQKEHFGVGFQAMDDLFVVKGIQLLKVVRIMYLFK